MGGAETEASLMKMTIHLPRLDIEMHKLTSFPRKTWAYVTCKKRPANVWCRCAGVIGKGNRFKHRLKTYKRWLLKYSCSHRFIISNTYKIQGYSNTNVFCFIGSAETKVIKCFADSGAVTERSTGFIWCDCDIYWFVIQIKSDTMSTDSLDIKDLSICLPVVGIAGVCSFTHDTFLYLFSAVCAPCTWIRLSHLRE